MTIGKKLLSLIFASFPLYCCIESHEDGTVASTSVAIGNPTKVGLIFIAQNTANQRVRISGGINIFAPGQIPVFDSLPFATFRVADQDSFELGKGVIENILGSHLSDSTFMMPGDSIAAFNLLVQAKEGTAIVRGLRYQVRKGYFLGNVADTSRGFPVYLQRKVSFAGTIRIPGEFFGRPLFDFYTCIPGTPYFAKLDSVGAFTMSAPKGKYEASFVVHQMGGSASGIPWMGKIFELDDSLFTENPGVYTPGPPTDSIYAK